MRRRLRKQLAVLGVLAALVLLPVSGIWLLVYEPPPPSPSPLPTYQGLAVVSTAIFRFAPARADLLAMVKNPNADAGVRDVRYTLEARAGSRVVAESSGNTFFLPGQEKPVVAIDVRVPDEATAVSVRFDAPDWVPATASFRSPSLIVVSRQGKVRAGANPLYEVKGELTNQSGLDFLTVEVTALGLDADGVILGVGRTFVGSLRALERREFTVSWPLPAGRVVSRTREYPEVNVFSPAAVQLRAGLPGQEPRPVR